VPRATVLKSTERYSLKTVLPDELDSEGGWVDLRRLSFREKLEKDAEAMKMRFDMNSSNGKSTDNINAEIAMINVHATSLEFVRCIVDHNLTDENGVKLNLRDPMQIGLLDPRVGAEIQELIATMNDFESESKRSVVDAEGK